MVGYRKDNVPVDVWDLNGKYIGRGIVVYCKDPELVPEEKRTSLFEFWGSPRITMDDGKVIFGVECWWSEVKNTPKPTPKQIDFEHDVVNPFELLDKAIDEAFDMKAKKVK